MDGASYPVAYPGGGDMFCGEQRPGIYRQLSTERRRAYMVADLRFGRSGDLHDAIHLPVVLLPPDRGIAVTLRILVDQPGGFDDDSNLWYHSIGSYSDLGAIIRVGGISPQPYVNLQRKETLNRRVMKILVTGAAGFIGSATIKALMKKGYEIIGIDNLNDYYDPELKLARLASTGIDRATLTAEGVAESDTYSGYRFMRLDLADREGIDKLFDREEIDRVINLGGQAGVRYSLVNPYAYIESNVVGFLNILENCRRHPVNHLVYASSSSVYGMRSDIPYRESDKTDTPVSLYAATKKSNELMAYAYSHLYGIPATGLRFFTVYGPWGRPDMAPYLFLHAVMEGKPIRVFNHGDMQRDFTYIDDIVEGVVRVLEHAPDGEDPHRVYNIGHSEPVELMDFIRTIERVSGKKAIMQMEDMQAGDVVCTYADTTRLEKDFDFHPQIGVEEGIRRYYEWYKEYYK